MKISQLVGPRTSEVVTADDPVPGAGQVLVEVVASGVCTSDVGAWLSHDAAASPLRLGHEMVGRVAATGRDAGRWQPGDLVTGLGGEGFATLAVMDANAVLPVPAGIEPAHAIGEPVADLEEALSRTGIRAGDRVAVVGLGFMGLGLVQLAKRHAPGLLVGVDPDPARRRRALALGADLVFAPDELPEEYRTDTGRATDARLAIVLEATGATGGLKTAGSLVRPFGTLCVVGYHHTGDAMMDMDLWYKAVTVVNGFCPDRTRVVAAMRDALGLIAERRFSYAPLITHRFALDEVDEAFRTMTEAGPDFVKGVLLL
ncbi:Threonine dehydrogenase [Streptomyces sp. DvalAA-14]|uniref:zinc-dependent alcohol dehydrogenase n=1 Tax=unclassified Streptomyces TaxID=2593676 RepID=UPI00081B51AA|nr:MULTISPECIES: zinc-binding dehydrogenase [unclassified Streptomyces]MYS21083.1 zinc-binding dehydrogenase [Streptomyces sp. SID4948]SCD83792.1 Threonine dehydrogenase [Streptomyces sp. DvalAA-14]